MIKLSGDFLNLIKKINTFEIIANLILNGKRLDAFPLRSGRRQGSLLLPLLFNTVAVGPIRHNKAR